MRTERSLARWPLHAQSPHPRWGDDSSFLAERVSEGFQNSGPAHERSKNSFKTLCHLKIEKSLLCVSEYFTADVLGVNMYLGSSSACVCIPQTTWFYWMGELKYVFNQAEHTVCFQLAICHVSAFCDMFVCRPGSSGPLPELCVAIYVFCIPVEWTAVIWTGFSFFAFLWSLFSLPVNVKICNFLLCTDFFLFQNS